MKYSKSHRGWYKLSNPEKFIQPIDKLMESSKKIDEDILIQYKSSLERRMFVYADINPKVKYFSIEPFAIKYLKPTDNKIHRYYIDVFLEFNNGSKFLVEIKSFAETQMPSKKLNERTYKKQLETYLINQSKWKSAKEFADKAGLKFIIMTEKELK